MVLPRIPLRQSAPPRLRSLAYRDTQSRIRKAVGVITGKSGDTNFDLGGGESIAGAAARDLGQIAGILT
ncbi:MAG: hypothetical protein ACRD4O_10785, partial [Bryobacteraceae bacterium]